MKKRNWQTLITEDQFWEIVEKSLENAQGSSKDQYDELQLLLKDQSIDELVGFWYWGSELNRKAISADLWAAPYIARRGCGDDNFHYFRCWLIHQGKEVYNNALANPDSLFDVFNQLEFSGDILGDSISLIAEDIYQEKNQDDDLDLYDYMETEFEMVYTHEGEQEKFSKMIFSWDENDEESMRKICPKIFGRFWNNPLKRNY